MVNNDNKPYKVSGVYMFNTSFTPIFFSQTCSGRILVADPSPFRRAMQIRDPSLGLYREETDFLIALRSEMGDMAGV